MVTIYSIVTAIVIFSASRAEGLYYDNVFISQAQLNDASELSIEAHIGVLHDRNVWEQIQAHELSGSGPEIIEFLYSQLSAEAQASMERSGGADQAYLDEVYLAHNVEREKAMRSFDLAAAWSRRASTYQTLATVLAVGLAFAAWASLMDQASRMRGIFAVASALVLLASLGFLGFHLVTREPIEEYLLRAGINCAFSYTPKRQIWPDSAANTRIPGRRQNRN
jgi:hypothetical protein